MNLQMLTLNIPEPLYDQLKQRASENQRTIEAETLDVLAVHVPVVHELPDALASALANIGSLDDEALWRAARSRLSDDEAAQLEELHFKEQSEDLSAEESNLKAALMQQYERAMLVRAHAAAVLQQRGHKVDELLSHP